ncbi:hypothetical protein ACW7C8_27660 [Klebsiella pneumoniae]|nr:MULTISPECIES: hypothetical protein [Klebsiella]HBW1982287.1 hypothetical protein [Klebsiella quasipneumoniae subsp. similipneumoniae]AWO39746.1 hypothetical protein DLJ66_03515 [Klebsiella pneumoniae]AWO44649.1 hypothetical protein DLJ67_01405 [Klebsiella pneumoniae]AWS73327.1 hypothetical protein AM466_09745 [Klebsiella pneumoniae]EIV5271159.1 hypothetical protein [Klebsiella pneumoniae]
MDKFDRKLQREILQACVDSYPAAPLLEQFNLTEVAECAESNIQKLLANINYLCEHGLIKNHSSIILNDHSILTRITATAKGIDFMLNDGGLSAILNVQTIKLHRDTVVVLEDLIAISNMNDEQKEKAKSTLGEMSTEAIKTVVQAVTTAGFSALLGK